MNTMDAVEARAGQEAGRLVLVDVREAFICQSGRRSAMAATAARRADLDAHNVSGGMIAWERQGLDTSARGRTR